MNDEALESDSDEESQWSGPSKSQRKRDAQAFIDLGERIIELSAPQLIKLSLPEELAAAVDQARKTSSHSARKRQLKFIGKLLRNTDNEPVQRALAAIDASSDITRLRQHRVERYVTQLLSHEMAHTLDEIIANYPSVDRQRLRQLIRSSQSEIAHEKPPKSRRLLFRYLRELDEQLALAEANEQ